MNCSSRQAKPAPAHHRAVHCALPAAADKAVEEAQVELESREARVQELLAAQEKLQVGWPAGRRCVNCLAGGIMLYYRCLCLCTQQPVLASRVVT